MAALVIDPVLEDRLISHRRATGADRHDEVWEGVYVMSPMADNEHQHLGTRIAAVLTIVIDWAGLGSVFAGVNVSDRRKNWEENFRCPDMAVFLKGTKAKNRKTHWYGGPDFGIEIVSPRDRTLEKLPFYEKVGTRELLVIDRKPWSLTLYRLVDGRLVEAGRMTPRDSRELASEVLPVTWRLASGKGRRPQIEIGHADGVQHWTVETDAE